MRFRFQVCAVLLVGAVLASLLRMLSLPELPRRDLVFLYVAPLSAWVMIAAFILTVPSFIGARVGKGHAFVLPLAFLAFTLATATFWDYREVSLVAPRPRLALIQLWLAPFPLVATFMLQALGVWTLAGRD